MKHNGRYSCLASNMAGDTELIFNVEIQGLFNHLSNCSYCPFGIFMKLLVKLISPKYATNILLVE